MDDLKYNSEGYYDPTTYETLTKIERKRYSDFQRDVPSTDI